MVGESMSAEMCKLTCFSSHPIRVIDWDHFKVYVPISSSGEMITTHIPLFAPSVMV